MEDADIIFLLKQEIRTLAEEPLFYQALNDMMMERTNALLAQIDSFNDQAQQAEYERDSQITGTGIEIFTNDIISFGVWAAMESKEIKKQSSVANAQFNNKIDTIMQSLEDRTNTRLSQYESNVWLPQLKNSVDLFIIRLFEKYINILISNNKFNPDALKYNDITKSQSILQNINATENKVGILNAAFSSCPYNPDIYDVALGICDTEEIVNCAKQLGIDDGLKSKYTNLCHEIVANDRYSEEDMLSNLSPYISVVSLLEGKTVKEKQDEYVGIHRKNVLDRISSFADDLQNASNERIKHFIYSISITPIAEMDKLSDEELQEYIRSMIITDIVRTNEPTMYEDAISNKSNELLAIVKHYLAKVSSAKAEYLTSKASYDTYNDSSYKEIEMLNSQISELSIFSFSKKKDLNARIKALRERSDELEKSSITLEKAYYALIYPV